MRDVWLFQKANWPEYQLLINFHEKVTDFNDINSCLKNINSNILDAANKTIPKLTNKNYKKYVPWWSDEVKKAIQQRKRALRAFKKNPIPDNFIIFKKYRAIARRIVREKQEESWKSFILSIDEPISSSLMWAQIRKMKGKRPYNPISALKKTNEDITMNKQEITELLADFYAENSSDAMYSPDFIHYKQREQNRLQIPPLIGEEDLYNSPFSYCELINSFKNCRSSAAGIDGIPYQLIIQLPHLALEKLLDFFNFIWLNGLFPDLWKTALIIPVLKPDKSPLEVASYRPISLLCCANKILEKMISKRLKWLIEEKNLVDTYQSGNRKQRSTMDNLVLLEHEVATAFQNKEYVIAVFLDITKFFDRISKISILSKFIKKKISGPMFHYVNNFLSSPQISVKIEHFKSFIHILHNSVPQGSSLSGDLSNIATYDFSKCLPPNIMHGMFVDDIVVYMRSGDVQEAQQQLQLALSNIESWSKKNGLNFSVDKTFAVVFTRNRFINSFQINFHNHPVQFRDSVKWLGLHLNFKWTFQKHIIETKSKCLRAMNIMKILSNRKTGLRRHALLRLYNAFVLPILDYGSIIYGSARSNWLNKLNVVHHSALRLISGAFRTSPIVSLLAESGQPSLDIRRKVRCVNYVSNISINPKNPVHILMFNPKLEIIITNDKLPKNLRSRVGEMEGVEFCLEKVIKKTLLNHPPWVIIPPLVKILTSISKNNLTPQEVNKLFMEFKSENFYKSFCFTDGTKSENHCGGAYSFNETLNSFKLNPVASVFTAELMAIYLCLCHIHRSVVNEKMCLTYFVICSDSKSSLQAMSNTFTNDPLLQKTFSKIMDISSFGCSVSFLWIPSHLGIKGNDLVDRAARNSVSSPLLKDEYSANDYKAFFKFHQRASWLNSWRQNHITGRKLRAVKQDVKFWKSSIRDVKQEEVVLCRLRIGHSLATHRFLLEKSPPPSCEFCSHTLLSIDLWFLSCSALSSLRRKHKIESSMQEILKDDPERVSRCMKFLYEAKLFLKI